MNDERLDEQMHDAAQAYNVPPEPPRDEMWKNIRAARDPNGGAGIPAPLPPVQPIVPVVSAGLVLPVGSVIGVVPVIGVVSRSCVG